MTRKKLRVHCLEFRAKQYWKEARSVSSAPCRSSERKAENYPLDLAARALLILVKQF